MNTPDNSSAESATENRNYIIPRKYPPYGKKLADIRNRGLGRKTVFVESEVFAWVDKRIAARAIRGEE